MTTIYQDADGHVWRGDIPTLGIYDLKNRALIQQWQLREKAGIKPNPYPMLYPVPGPLPPGAIPYGDDMVSVPVGPPATGTTAPPATVPATSTVSTAGAGFNLSAITSNPLLMIGLAAGAYFLFFAKK